MNLSRTQKVLHRLPFRDGRRTIYRHRDDNPYDPAATTVYINADDYLDLGRPDTITVTIEPGDRLNTPQPAARIADQRAAAIHR